MTKEEATEFCASHNLTPFAVYEEPARLIVPDTMKSTPNRAEIEFYLDATDTYRVGKATIYQDGFQIAAVKQVPNFRPILHMTEEKAREFCNSHMYKPCIVYREPSHITTYSDKTVPNRLDFYLPNRVELDLYLDATDTYCVGKAIVYQDFNQVAVVETDECDECGGPCDGVHAKSIDTKQAKQESRVKELVETIATNEPSIVKEVIREMDQRRVSKIIEVLSIQDPVVISEVIQRLKSRFGL